VIAADIFIQPLHQGIAFLKEREIVLSDDIWQVIIRLNTDLYIETISTLRNDLSHIETHKQEFTPLSELQVIETSLDTLETGLLSFNHLLPKLDPRRALFDIVGRMFKTLFGTAVVTDITTLHQFTEELKKTRT
jgi:hypothetical protein